MSNTWRKRRRVLKDCRRRARKLLFEQLEARQLLSITPNIAGGSVTFAGDAADDSLLLRKAASGQLEWSEDGGDTFLPVGAVSSVTVDLGDGEDTVEIVGSHTLSLDDLTVYSESILVAPDARIEANGDVTLSALSASET